MEDEITELCNELDVIRKEQVELRSRLAVLNARSTELDGKLNKTLHSKIDPLLKNHWSVRFNLYKEQQW